MILEHIAFARRIGLPYVYLGYWIDGSRKMAYKTRFKPQERLGPDRWERIYFRPRRQPEDARSLARNAPSVNFLRLIVAASSASIFWNM